MGNGFREKGSQDGEGGKRARRLIEDYGGDLCVCVCVGVCMYAVYTCLFFPS